MMQSEKSVRQQKIAFWQRWRGVTAIWFQTYLLQINKKEVKSSWFDI